MSTQRARLVCLISLSAMLLFSPNLHGQGLTGSLTGNITDPAGAALPNATVKLSNVDTGVSATATTNAGGVYLFTNLQPGTYNSTISAPSFSTLNQNGIT